MGVSAMKKKLNKVSKTRKHCWKDAFGQWTEKSFYVIRSYLGSTKQGRLGLLKAIFLTSHVEFLKTHMRRLPLHHPLFHRDQNPLAGRAGQGQEEEFERRCYR